MLFWKSHEGDEKKNNKGGGKKGTATEEGRQAGARLCVSLFTIPYSHHACAHASAASRGSSHSLAPVISDNVNDLEESPAQRMICDMWEGSERGRTRQVSAGSVWDPGDALKIVIHYI